MRLRVVNVHQVTLQAPAERVGALLDTLATRTDELWPTQRWPRMAFEGGLRVGAVGGHGPIRYRVLEHEPGRRVRFGFLGPAGLEGDHWLEVLPGVGTGTVLRHGLVAGPRGAMRWQWPLVFRPLHDALIEDALVRAAAWVSGDPARLPALSPRVRVLRRLMARRGRAPGPARASADPAGPTRG